MPWNGFATIPHFGAVRVAVVAAAQALVTEMAPVATVKEAVVKAKGAVAPATALPTMRSRRVRWNHRHSRPRTRPQPQSLQ